MALLFFVALGTACHRNSSVVIEKAKRQGLAWNLKTTIDVYNQAGFTNFGWDHQARECLAEFARGIAGETNADEPMAEIIATNASVAVNAGCNDPLVNYLLNRYSTNRGDSREAFETAACKAARDLNNSGYPPIWKFYSAAWALDWVYHVYRTNSYGRPEKMEMLNGMYTDLQLTLEDKTMPANEAYAVAERALYMTSGSKENHALFYDLIEKQLFNNWPDAPTTWLFKGKYYIDEAWKARGHGYANAVTPEGWAGFTNNLAVARDALEHGWSLYPKLSDIADAMIGVVLGQDGGRDQMELWFNRAMEANPNDYEACRAKLNFLAPEWYGSQQDQLAFGRECVQSLKWGGSVPLTLVDAHAAIYSTQEGEARINYWRQPQVWADLQAAYDRFFQLNPHSVNTYNYYAWYAYHAGQWDKLNELIPKLDPVNYRLFGGTEGFDRMVQAANAHK